MGEQAKVMLPEKLADAVDLIIRAKRDAGEPKYRDRTAYVRAAVVEALKQEAKS